MVPETTSPTARALLVLELLQSAPGITADRLGEQLGVSERAARRYVAVLREAGVPIESTRGPYGGYRVGRGLRLPPLMFTASEALGLVMAVLEGHHDIADSTGSTDPVGGAIGKIVRVLPEPVARSVEAVRRVRARGPDPDASPGTDTTAALVQACGDRRRLRFGYRLDRDRDPVMEVDPWAVVVRYGRWYLLCWSHTAGARRVLRMDRVAGVEVLDQTFEPPEDLDPLDALEQHLSEGWRYDVEVVVDAPFEEVARRVRRNVGRLEPIDETHTRLVGSTDEPWWYAEHLAELRAPFHVVGPPELRDAVRDLGRMLLEAAEG
jgi:predicted DNA-binding transcriptional regulator YafY